MGDFLKKILVIEDAEEFRSLLQMFFSSRGIAAEFAANGQEALDKLNSMAELPGLILLDMVMPVMDGAEFRKIQERDPRLASIPVVLMSAHNDLEINSIRIGAKDRISKPSPLEKWLAVVEKNYDSNN